MHENACPAALTTQLTDLATGIVSRALDAGATHAEVYIRQGSEASIQIRDGAIEELQEGHPRSVGLRLWRDDRVASTYASDLRDEAISRSISDALELADLADPVPESALADPALLATTWPDLDLYDPGVRERSAVEKLELVRACEAAALAADDRVSRSAGARYGDAIMHRALATSTGFVGGYHETVAHLSVEAIADDSEGKKRNGSWLTFGRHLGQLLEPGEVGRIAAERAVRQLGSGPVPTKRLPVVFDPRAGAALLGLLFSVVRGAAIERGASYLTDRLGASIGAAGLTLIDDPLIPQGPGSRPFDGEGLPSRVTTFVDEGVLRSFALNSYSARKLGLAPTGHASRYASGAPGEGHTNLRLAGGSRTPAEIIGDVEYGFYCESMMGFGFNATTGDFSRGASGRLIENGALTKPVSEVTLSANFLDLFAALDAVGDDVDRTRSVMSPTFRIAEMTLAGS